jgi:dUTPase
MRVKIQRIDKAVDLPAYHSKESAAFDFSSSEDAVIAPKEINYCLQV